jgi:hypothetical protein
MPGTSSQVLKIATWNLDRPKRSNEPRSIRILGALEKIGADILILTETNTCINPGIKYVPFSSSPLLGSSFGRGEEYERGENRVTIWVKKEFVAEQRPDLCDSHSSICVRVATSLGTMNIYGTVLGIYGLGGAQFDTALKVQMSDWRRLAEHGPFCIAGDFNIFLEDSTSYSKTARLTVQELFNCLEVEVPSQNISRNVDHLAFSKSFLSNIHLDCKQWNEGQNGKPPDRNISSHLGVCITLKRFE